MHRRPLSVSIIGWILTIMGVLSTLGAFMSLFMLDDPRVQQAAAASAVPLPVQLAVSIGTCIITFVCGVNILSGANWARWLYAVWCAALLVFAALFSPNKLMIIPTVLIQGTIILFLFLPRANAYFSRD
jgi:hypothetical protein